MSPPHAPLPCSYRGLEPTAADFGVVRRLAGLSMHRDVSLAGVVSRAAAKCAAVCSTIKEAGCREHGSRLPLLSNGAGRLGAALQRPAADAICPSRAAAAGSLSVVQLGYVASWSSYTAYRREQPHEPDPLHAFRQRLLQALRLGEEAAAAPAPLLRLEWPLFGFLAKDPAPLPAD